VNGVGMSHPFENSLFLIATGQGRSGTTVLTKSLGQHPDVHSNLVESNVLKDVLSAGYSSSTMPSRVRQMVLPRDQHDTVFREMLLKLLFPVDAWSAPEPPRCISTFSAMSPEAAEFAVRIFPRVHLANIVRHGVEVVSSRMVHRALGKHSFESHCHAWAAAKAMAQWGADRSDFTLIRHENILKQRTCEEMFEQLFERAGLEPGPSVIDYVMQKKFNQTRYEFEQETTDGDLSNRKERWRHWTSVQQATFREICGETMTYFGYEIPE